MKKIVITTGDPAGCGPQITLKAINALKNFPVEFIIVGDKAIMKKIPLYARLKKRVVFIDADTPGINNLAYGCASKLSGLASLSYLNIALQIMSENSITRLVTAPVSKEAIQMVAPAFAGHTEYLAMHYKVKNVVMMMASKKLKVILFTRHCALREVAGLISKNSLIGAFSLVLSSLKEIFTIKNPRIAVASLNPHAGINTFLDKEEKTVLYAVKKFPGEIFGPYPCDTLFMQEKISRFHCIFCLYHDQAMMPFKLLSFKNGVNVTLGLPITRTSPDHGVAYEFIRKNKTPFYSSMQEAVKLALKLSP
ncbi:MAG: 4-hydroxythreonine-4-phosphate dehydrogenase PdxA [Candidatus Omnitrophica bacterium]|nr:4-hydroxythreonine-4-phosphate dehydrogenase PdxA [Candidatus Omnitrophota bacterium]